jgi:Tol biopolymer transport system component
VGLSDTDFSQPRWSPDGESVAVSLRPVNANISKALWVLHLDGLFNRQITDDPRATFTAYEWDPWGDRLVYQRYDLGSSKTSIWMWQSGESKMIIDSGTRPKWLP